MKEHGHDSRACSSSRNAFRRDATLVPGVFVPLDQRSGACAVREEDSRYEIEERRIGEKEEETEDDFLTAIFTQYGG